MSKTTERPLFKEIAAVAGALHRCKNHADATWCNRHDDILTHIERDLLPHGSGIDNGCKIDRDKSTDDKIVIRFSFHHINDNGYYCGWSDYVVTVTPAFSGICLKISGRNVNDVKDYLADTFYHCLTSIIAWDTDKQQWYSVEMRKAAEAYEQGIANGTIV